MVARTYTATMVGLQPVKIDVEVEGTQGIPTVVIIGLPSKAVDEAKERVLSALMNCGITPKSKRTVINLAPADLKKNSSGLELAIALGLLQMYGVIPPVPTDTMLFGELSLDGELKPIRGALPLVLAAKQLGFKRVIMPQANVPEVVIVDDITIHPLNHLKEYLAHVCHHLPIPIMKPESFKGSSQPFAVDFQDVQGQSLAKRALEISAAGGHNLIMMGPPGSGKTMLAQALVSILPPLSQTEALEITPIYSICGLTGQGLITQRPFRSPHHTTSTVGLVGGGPQIRPGEISLAHRGVLFMDELPEFAQPTLEALRQPLEQGTVTIVRAAGSMKYPASFTLVGAANPCPCGYFGSLKHPCTCAVHFRNLYQKRLSGPFLDRIDIHIDVPEMDLRELSLPSCIPEKSSLIQARVIAARQRQTQRLQSTGFICNAELPSPAVKKFCPLNHSARQLLLKASGKLKLSTRGYYKVIKLAQTIADLEAETTISQDHIQEALGYRPQPTSTQTYT